VLLRPSPLERGTVFPLVICLVVALGLTAQFRSYAGPDTGFLLDEAGRILDGARPYVHLVEMNPPLTLLLNVGTVGLARALGLPEILVYRLVCTAILLALLWLDGRLLRRLLPQDVVLRRATMLLLVFAFFGLAGQDFGQREHLLLALILPFLLVASTRAAGLAVPAGMAVLAGLLAGSAFGLKPHFVLLWPAVEIYLRVTRRVRWTELLPETAAVGGFLAVYATAILVWTPAYPRLVKLLAGTYAGFLYVPFWQLLLTGPGVLLTICALLATLALGRHTRRPELPAIFAVASLACLAAGTAQQKGFSYHFYPAYAVSTILLGVLIWGAGESSLSWVHRVYRVIAVSALATAVLIAASGSAIATVDRVRDSEHEQMERVLPVIRERGAGAPVYVMSYNISSAYPLINYAGARSASRFPQLWILGAVYLEQLRRTGPLRYRDTAEMSPSERFLNQAVYEDLRDEAPKLLVVLQHGRDLPGNGFRRLDYVAYFRRDPRIASLLDRYQLIANSGDFVVYERLADGAARSGPPPMVRPGTRDIVGPRANGGVSARLADAGLLLPVLAFVISALCASLVEKVRAAPRHPPKTAVM
jgi:hypothetical protein